MPKFTVKRAANAEKLRVHIPDYLYSQISGLATRANTSMDDVVCQCLGFALRQLQHEEEPSTTKPLQQR